MRKFENYVRLTGIVSVQTVHVSSHGNRCLADFGIRIPSSQKTEDASGSHMRTVYAIMYVKGFFDICMKEDIIRLLCSDRSIVTIEGRLQAENYVDRNGNRRERIVLAASVLEEAGQKEESLQEPELQMV